MYVLLEKHKLNPDGRENLVSQVAGEMERNRYYSTQEKLALFLLGRQFADQAGDAWTAEMIAAGKPQPVGGKGTQFQPLSAGEIAAGVKIRNTHKERLFVELNFAGNPAKMPAARTDVFNVKREWYGADGKPLGNLGNRALRVGETVIVRLNVKTAGRYANGLVVDYIPAGLGSRTPTSCRASRCRPPSPASTRVRRCRTSASSTSNSATTASWWRPGWTGR